MKRKPVTITINEDIQKKIRLLQALLISETSLSWSFSLVIHELLVEGLKKFNTHKVVRGTKK